MSVSYCRVTFDDGSTKDYPIEAFEVLADYMRDRIGRPVLQLTDLCGDVTIFFVSKVQDIYCSSPHGRQRAREINAELKQERLIHGEWED